MISSVYYETLTQSSTKNIKKTKSILKKTKCIKPFWCFTPTQSSEPSDYVLDFEDSPTIIDFNTVLNQHDISYSKSTDSNENVSNEDNSTSPKSDMDRSDIKEKLSNESNKSFDAISLSKRIHSSNRIQYKPKTKFKTSYSMFRENLCIVKAKVNYFKKKTNVQELNDFKEYTKNCFDIINRITPPDIESLAKQYITLPFEDQIGFGRNKKRLAIFDLDETLIHCEWKDIENAHKIIDIKISSEVTKRIGLNIRPKFKEELLEIQKKYILIIYTASQQKYADTVINAIDPDKEWFAYRWYRNNCTEVKFEGKTLYIKDLRLIRNISFKDIVIIDNSVLSFAFNWDNGIPILPYYQGEHEFELKYLRKLLINLADCKDIQKKLKQLISLKKYREQSLGETNCEEDYNDDTIEF